MPQIRRNMLLQQNAYGQYDSPNRMPPDDLNVMVCDDEEIERNGLTATVRRLGVKG